jgi:hypothetical protein
VILYSPTPDPAFRKLIRDANRVYFLSIPEELKKRYSYRPVHCCHSSIYENGKQKTLERWAVV